MLRAWATVLASLASGGVGAVVVTLLRGRQEREENWGNRLVAAADDFSTGAFQAILTLRTAGDAVLDAEADEPTRIPNVVNVEAAIAELERRVDEAHARLARIHLLFDADSEAGQAAASTILNLAQAVTAIRTRPPEHDACTAALKGALEQHASFGKAALKAIRAGE